MVVTRPADLRAARLSASTSTLITREESARGNPLLANYMGNSSGGEKEYLKWEIERGRERGYAGKQIGGRRKSEENEIFGLVGQSPQFPKF